jgi:subtilisin family serine protease
MLRRCVIALLLSSLVPLGAATTAGGSLAPASGRYIVVLKDSADPGDVAARVTGLGATVQGLFSSVNGLLVSLPVLKLKALRNDPRVAYVAPDGPVHLLAEPTPTGVTRIGAASRLRPDGSLFQGPDPTAAVAVLDTGIYNHPDLNVVGGVDCASDLLGDLLGGSGFSDRNGHGTHVAGTIGAKADGQGVVGVAPGTPLYAVRVFSSLGVGSMSDVVCGLDWVAENAAAKNIKVVNMSLGGSGTDDGACGTKNNDPLHAAVCRVVAAGVTVVVAAGNDHVDLVQSVPAAYDEVMTVAAMADFDGLPGGLAQTTCSTKDQDDTAADFSNFALPGSPDAAHTITAPGVCIYSTWNNGGYKSISGTSMASPHVAGVVTRCIDAGPCAGLTPAQIIAKLRTDAAARPADSGFLGDDGTPVPSQYYGDLVDSSRF